MPDFMRLFSSFPGAVILIFELPDDVVVVHTGDMRGDESVINALENADVSWTRHTRIVVYLDTVGLSSQSIFVQCTVCDICWHWNWFQTNCYFNHTFQLLWNGGFFRCLLSIDILRFKAYLSITTSLYLRGNQYRRGCRERRKTNIDCRGLIYNW